MSEYSWGNYTRRWCRVIAMATALASAAVSAESGDDRNEARSGAKGSVATYLSQPQLTFAIDKFWGVGTAQVNAAKQIVVGDFVGYDASDVDGDGNAEQIWFTGSAAGGNDSDLLISQRAFVGNVRLTFNACIGITRLSYQYIAIGFSNPSFTGAPGSAVTNPPANGYEIGFMTRWEDQSSLHIWRDSASTVAVPPPAGPVATADGYCAAYELRRTNNQVVARVNGATVYAGPAFTATGPTAIFVRTWDTPIKLWNVKWQRGGDDDDENDHD